VIYSLFVIVSLSSLRTKRCSRSLHLTIGRRQNDRVYAPRDTRKYGIAAERLLRCRPMFRKSLMVSVAVSKLGCSPLFFVEPGVKVDGRYYRDVLYWNSSLLTLLLVMHRIAGDMYVFQQDSAPAHRARDTVQLLQRLQSLLHPTWGSQTAQTWTRLTTVYGVSYRNEFTRLQCVTQMTSSSASLRLDPEFHRLSSTKPLTSGLRLRACIKA